MPEIITQYPDIVLSVLKSAGIKCGVGEKQNILVTCPADQFCRAPSGEICVYGLQDIPKMTQIKSTELYQYVYPWPSIISWPNFFLLMIIFIAGLYFGKWLNKKQT